MTAAVVTGPAFIAAGAVAESASTTSLSPATPANVANSHGLLIAVVVVKAFVTTSTATPGWTKLYETNASSFLTQAVYIANGAAASPTISWTGANAAYAQVAFYDDPHNPVETAVVGATSVNTGNSTSLSTTTMNTTRANSVVIALGSISTNTTLTTPAGFTENLSYQTGAAGLAVAWDAQLYPNSGTATGAVSMTAGLTGHWVLRLIELLLVVKPTGNYSIETEITAVTKVADGSLTEATDITTVTKVADGLMADSTSLTTVTKVANGLMAESIEIVAILTAGTEPAPGPIDPEVTRVRAWGFPLDGHDFYVLRVGEELTAVFDLTTGTQVEWNSKNRAVWRAQTGAVWLAVQQVVDAGSTVIAGDDSSGVIWTVDPEVPYDELIDFETGTATFERVVSSRVPLRMRNSVPCDAVYVTLSAGEPFAGAEQITLYTSDNEGRTWTNHGSRTLTAGDYTQEVAWRSLGLMRAPGRLFEIRDEGATGRISSIDIRFRGGEGG